jgi:NAD(P)-dependent dehydrogenase (short-subunit alcohol dehydrogenase family)
MVKLSVVRAANVDLEAVTRPTTAVFVGATRGIGRATLLELARRKRTGLKVYVVGRNANNQQPLLDQLRAINANGDFIFLEGQITQLAEIKRICSDIRSRESSIDLLWLSAGTLPFDGRIG